MKINNQHILSRVNFELNTASESFAFEKRQTIDSFLKDDLLPDIEILLDELASPEEIKRFESIDIEVDVSQEMDSGDLKNLLVSQLRRKIEIAQTDFFETIENKVSSFDQSDRSEKQNINYSIEHDKKLEVPLQESTQAGQSQNKQNIFLDFLETGQLPWYATSSLLTEFIRPETFQAAIQDKFFLKKLIDQFYSDKNSLQRFLLQMENELIEKFIHQLAIEKRLEATLKLRIISNFSQPIQIRIYELIINSLVKPDFRIQEESYLQFLHEMLVGQKPASSVKKSISQIHEMLGLINPGIRQFAIETDWIGYNQNAINEEVEHQMADKQKEENQEINNMPSLKIEEVNQHFQSESRTKENEIAVPASGKNMEQKVVYIQNAGLVLAHVFIPKLLAFADCTIEKTILPEKKSLAVHLLHYLATGEEQEFECNLVFEKYLCEIAPEFPISRKILLTDQEKEKCDELLKSMIGHWSALKSSSPEALRQSFLQRNGKLDLQQSPHKLHVERKTLDILLNSLPWGISVVKLPWMTEVLYVTW